MFGPQLPIPSWVYRLLENLLVALVAAGLAGWWVSRQSAQHIEEIARHAQEQLTEAIQPTLAIDRLVDAREQAKSIRWTYVVRVSQGSKPATLFLYHFTATCTAHKESQSEGTYFLLDGDDPFLAPGTQRTIEPTIRPAYCSTSCPWASTFVIHFADHKGLRSYEQTVDGDIRIIPEHQGMQWGKNGRAEWF